MTNFKLFNTITKEEAIKFRQDLEEGDILAISHLLYTQSTKENSFPTITFLNGLTKMNELIFSMENEEVEYDLDFYILYRSLVEFISQKCLEIITEENTNKINKEES